MKNKINKLKELSLQMGEILRSLGNDEEITIKEIETHLLDIDYELNYLGHIANGEVICECCYEEWITPTEKEKEMDYFQCFKCVMEEEEEAYRDMVGGEESIPFDEM